MSFWRRVFGRESKEQLKPQRLDYLNEGLALERQGDFGAALTSYRLAYRDNPNDSRILLSHALRCTARCAESYSRPIPIQRMRN